MAIKYPLYIDQGKIRSSKKGDLVKPTFSIYNVVDEVPIEINSQMIVDSLEIGLTGLLEIEGNLRII